MAEITVYHEGPTVSLRASRERGDARFFTGAPCKNGHVAQRYTSNSACVECQRVATGDYFRRNRERLRSHKIAYHRQRRISGIEAQANRRLRHRKQAEAAGRQRPSVCDICRETSGKICFDHNHATGEFRGWLCDRCNRALGLVRDNAPLLRRLARYLEKSREASLV